MTLEVLKYVFFADVMAMLVVMLVIPWARRRSSIGMLVFCEVTSVVGIAFAAACAFHPLTDAVHRDTFLAAVAGMACLFIATFLSALKIEASSG